ncbi:hypothetical protein EW145_g4762 [Phellinidium pouzarii]|uniref:BTB domain-containing protein n=1 Tax=Phellinidium pouzarii TaxID=167371 RepID=A0A4S4L2B4_9AGAM|nr:hypothetical protein EW145_g4762 [Phellinidium pouzarii]
MRTDMLVDITYLASGSVSPTLASSSGSNSPSPVASDSSSLAVESRQADFWFKDGNVILLAGSIAFKVHRGILERHSDVFHDLLSIPQPPDEVMFEECHIIELHDEPTDLWYLLKALYDGMYLKQLCASDFRNITAVLRLSTKYFIEHLRERCVNRLMIDWPCTLNCWDSREIEATDPFGRYSPRARFAHPILVINFAREMGITNLLPCAFYDLCRYGPSKIVAGVLKSQSDGPIKGNAGITNSEAVPVHLSLDDLRIALLGRERAQRVVAAFIEDELSNREPADDCHNRERDGGRICRESFYFIMLNLLRSIGGLANGRDCDPLFSLTQASEMMSRTDFSDGTQFCSLKICAACKMDFSQSVKAARERVWMQIPSWFGMEDFNGMPFSGMLAS